VPEQRTISVLVKHKYWEAYLSSVFLTAFAMRKFLYVLVPFGVVGMVLVVGSYFHGASDREWATLIENVRPLLWLLVGMMAFLLVLPLYTARTMVSDKRFKQGIGYRFSDANVEIVNSVSKSEVDWTAFRRVKETGWAFLLFVNLNVAHVIPKRCFESTEDVQALREMISGHFPKAKLRRD
jgi:hypothetical protein